MITKNKIKARTALTIHVMGLANNVAAALAAVLQLKQLLVLLL